ncbi:glycerophosphocholine phosphodiesterase GPCPD1 [Drosophila pseudoobscura]|uniref:Glycerophosphocholine phosphodiesterase GPCPD1 n=1 Tax=Drosophila pseudoobscura pseudoobscura TaxID=46245 RepID=A0A6I8UBT1_DROPS|nr:glycerophosphocholine phosphodiesterase GPCPD1 [Drosophila pseudoobscura]
MYRFCVLLNVLKSISILLFLFMPLLLLLLLPLPLSYATTSRTELNETLVFAAEKLQAFKIFDDEQQPAGQVSGRSFICVPLFRVFSLELRHNIRLAADEYIAVSGDHAALGYWQLEKAVPLKAQDRARTKWYLRLWVCASQRFYYRYLIYAKNGQGRRILRSWEGQKVARMMQTYEIYRSPGLDIFGEAYPRSVGGGFHLERGWLQHEYVIELKFVWQDHMVIQGVGSKAKLRLALTPLNVIDDSRIEVAKYVYNHSSFRPLSALGVKYSQGSIVIFRISQPLDIYNAFRLSIYQTGSKQSLGEVYIFPEQIRGSRGTLQLPIFASLQTIAIGQLSLPYLVVLPMPKVEACNLRESFHHYWPDNWPTMDVGYRGLGASYYQASTTLTENTIESFLAVMKAKGDMVQLDVQLTKDYVPVVWHGFGFYTSGKDQQIRDRFDLRYVLIRELTYAELKASRVFILKRWSLQEYTHLNLRDSSQSQRIFPKLSEVYEALPKSLGLLVEIKWPQLMASGLLESTQSLNKNVYVDRILQTTVRYGCGRPLIFASFDADICTMIRLKQQVFPAILMSIGRSNIWDPYMDLRAQSFQQAVNFAHSADILGTALHVENFAQKHQLLSVALDLKQVIFLWGNDLGQDEHLIEQFRALDATGVIYDHMDRVGPASWKRSSFFRAPQLLELFGAQCVASGNSSTIPGAKPPKPTIWPKLR